MRDAFKIYTPLVLVVIVGFAVAAYFIRPAPPSSIRLATGAPGGAYAAFGEQYKAALAVDGGLWIALAFFFLSRKNESSRVARH